RWDQTLEELATSYAAKCIWDHNEERGFRGENLFIMSGSSLDVELGMADWHHERDYYNFTTNTCQEGQMCGHYTQMVWAHTQRVGCGEKFCEKLEGFEEPNMYLLVCNYEPPGNFQGEKPFSPGEPCTSCPPSTTCKDSLCADIDLELEETSPAPPGMTTPEIQSGITHSKMDPKLTQLEQTPEPTQMEQTPEPTQMEQTPEPTQMEQTPEPTQMEQTPEPTQSEQTPEPTQMEQTPEPTQMEQTPEPTQMEQTPEPTQMEKTTEPTQMEKTTEPTQSEQSPKPTRSEMVSKDTWSVLDPQVIPSDLVMNSISDQMTPEPLQVTTLQIMENSSPDVREQTTIQPTTQVITLPSQEYHVTSVRPSLALVITPTIDNAGIDKAFSNDEPDAPTVKEAVIPVTVSMIPTKPAKAHDMSKEVNIPLGKVISQDQARKKDSIQRPPKTSPPEKKEKQKNRNLTSFKWKNKWSSSKKWGYKSDLPVRTYFGHQSPHFVQPRRPCPYPCLSSQSKSPMVFPLYRTNHISPWGGYDKRGLGDSKPFAKLCKLLGHKRGVYSLYLPPAQR
ncbi:uncharacterized protein RB166_021254, partial [Leptodactylus fuscus]|uniref:uncharacterized protein LOC142187385 n=1 Tax=Leptodactylus fuscus TaxID=238119 RepID=UPI003F4E59E8